MRLYVEELGGRITPSDVLPVGADRSNVVEVVSLDGPRPIGPDGLPFPPPAAPDPYPTNAAVLLAVNLAVAAATTPPG